MRNSKLKCEFFRNIHVLPTCEAVSKIDLGQTVHGISWTPFGEPACKVGLPSSGLFKRVSYQRRGHLRAIRRLTGRIACRHTNLHLAETGVTCKGTCLHLSNLLLEMQSLPITSQARVRVQRLQMGWSAIQNLSELL